MNQSRLIIANALVIWTCRVLLLVPQLLLVPYLIPRIGEAGYGVYALVWSLLTGIDELQTSLQQGVVKYSAAYLAEGRVDAVNRVASSSKLYSVVLAVLASAGMAAASQHPELGTVGVPLLLVAILVLFLIPLTPYLAIIQSKQRYYVGVVSDTVSKYLGLGMTVAWFTWVGPSVPALIVIMTSTLLLSRLGQVPVAYRLVPGLRVRAALFDRTHFRLLLAFGGMTVVVSLLNVANTTGLRWLMGTLVSAQFVAHLAIMLMPSLLLAQVIQALTVTVMPATSAYEASGNYSKLQALLLRSTRYTAAIAMTAVMLAVVLLKDVLALWLGAEYTFLAPQTLVVFACMALLMSTSSAHHMLKGLGKLRLTVLCSFVGTVGAPLPVLLTTFALTHDPNLAVVTGLSMGSLCQALLHIGFAMRQVRASWRQAIVPALGQPLGAGVVVMLGASAVLAYGNVQSIVLRCVVAAIAVCGYWALLYGLFATASERQQARQLVQRFVRARSLRVGPSKA